MHRKIDRARDQTSPRKAMHKLVENKRNQRIDRKLYLAEYERTDTRRHYRNVQNKIRYQKQLIMSLKTDSGFDVICSSCLQYKSKHLCKVITRTDLFKYKKFVIRDCSLLKNRSNEKFLCNVCFNQIRIRKVPKWSKLNKIKFADYPEELIDLLKRECQVKEQDCKTIFQEDENDYSRTTCK